MEKEPILISACLLGLQCRYDGKAKFYDGIRELKDRFYLVPVCPEQMGGLATPRIPAECQGDRVVTREGQDVTRQYRQGAEEAKKLAELFECRKAVLKEKSPSCGCGRIYDGTFTRTLKEGNGVTAQALMEAGIQVLGESEIAALTDGKRDNK